MIIGDVTWEFWLCDPSGFRIRLLDEALEYGTTLVANDMGAFYVDVPSSFDYELLRTDRIIEAIRTVPGGPQKRVQVGFVRKWRVKRTGTSDVLRISGYDKVELLKRRIIFYGTAVNMPLDNTMKSIVRTCFGSVAGGGRNWEPNGFTVQPDLSLAPQKNTPGYGWETVLDALKKIGDMALQYGTRLYFDVVPVTLAGEKLGYEFRTYIGQLGQDRTQAPLSVVFGVEWGNLASPELTYDQTDEATVVLIGGSGEGGSRTVLTASDPIRINSSIWNYREVFLDAQNEGSLQILQTLGDAHLASRRPQNKFTGTLLDTNDSRFGIDWDFGDRVSIEYFGRVVSVVIDAITFKVTPRKEDLVTRFEVLS